MSARDGDSTESTPRTVADLLAQYGDGRLQSGGRRRRRANDPDDTAPQTIIDRVLSDSGMMRRVDEHGMPVPPSAGAGAPASPPHTPHAVTPPPAAQLGGTTHAPDALGGTAPGTPGTPGRSSTPAPETSAKSTAAWSPMVSGGSAAGSAPPRTFPPPRQQSPRMSPPPTTRPRHDEEPTETLPRIDPDAPNPPAAPHTVPPRQIETPQRGRYRQDQDEPGWNAGMLHTEQQPVVAGPDSSEHWPVVGQPEAPPLLPALRDDEPGRDRDRDGDESPAKEWLTMAFQLVIGAAGGAALWLAFQWLWRAIPVAALAVALVVITAMVWVVRRIRHSDDLQTTVVTVLVGLFVTVSPAALLLVGR